VAPPPGGETAPRIAHQTRIAATGVDEVHSFSYLPATFTTLFLLAASLLLGLMR
jgi:hypothetical protein